MIGSEYLRVVSERFRQMKRTAEEAMGQVSDSGLFWTENNESNSIVDIVNHMSDYMILRWTNLFVSDEEKMRNFENEFTRYFFSRRDIIHCWESGWQTFFGALEQLTEKDLLEKVTIAGQQHIVIEVIEKAMYHKAYHVGQIVYISKLLQGEDWKTINIM
ncbi:MAG: DinB family protein [Bacillus sp. (in: firmicutes)]